MPVTGDEVALTLDQIVVATDFTPISEMAVKYAAALTKRFSSKLTVANVVDLSVATRSNEAVVGSPVDEMRKDSAEKVQNVLNDLKLAGIHAARTAVEAHNPAAAVVRLADELRANLLVTGTHSRTGLQKLILGSFAEGVIHHAHCPVISIGSNLKVSAGEDIPFRTIVFATDLHHDSVQKAAMALTFAKDSLAQIYMCHVIPHPPSDLSSSLDLQFRSEKELSELIPTAAYEWCECTVEYGDVAEHILQLAAKTGADLIVLGARRSSGWFTHPLQGTVAHVLSKANCPVMTICTA